MHRLYIVLTALMCTLCAGSAAHSAETMLWPQQQHRYVGPVVRPEPPIAWQSSPSTPEYPGISLFAGGHSGNVIILNDSSNNVPDNVIATAVTGAAQTSPFSAAAPPPAVMGQKASQLSRNSLMLGRVHALSPVSGAISVDVPVQGNSVVITAESVLDAPAYGALSSSGPVSGNAITMLGGKALSLSGGGSESGEVSGNTVYFSGGEAGLHVEGGRSAGAVNGNKVFMSGGNTAVVRGGVSAKNAAKGNRVEVRGGMVTDAVIGGQSVGADPHTGQGAGLTTHNTVDIHTFATLAPEVRVYGGLAGEHSPAPATRSHAKKPQHARQQSVGNVLNFFAWSGALRSIEYFQYITLRLPHPTRQGDTLLRVAENMDLRGVSLRISGADGDVDMQEGASFTLLLAKALLTDKDTVLPATIVTLPSGKKAELQLSLDFPVDQPKTPHAVIATVTKVW